MNRSMLHEVAGDRLKALSYLMSEGLIRKDRDCPSCGREMTLYTQQGRATVFLCPKRCTTRGLLAESFFARRKLSPEVILILLYCWANGYTYKQALHESRRVKAEGPAVVSSSRTYRALGRDLSSLVIDHHLSGWERGKIGGKNVEVQVDESQFGSRHGDKGRPIEGRWVLGLLANGSIDFRTVVLAKGKRDKCLLTSQICEHVKPGSVIVTDFWKGYETKNLNQHGFKHKSVNHSDQKHPFVSAEGVHTQRIESYWSDMKAKFKQQSVREVHFEEWVQLYTWRRKCKQQNLSLFEEVIKIIKKNYPL